MWFYLFVFEDYPIYSMKSYSFIFKLNFPLFPMEFLPEIHPPTERGSNFLSFYIKTIDVTKGDHPEFYPMKIEP